MVNDLQKALKEHKLVIVLLAAGIVIWLAFFGIYYKGLVVSDAMHYAATARNIASGTGYHDSDIWPVNFAFSQTDYLKIFRNPPLFPYLLSVFFLVFGPSNLAAVLCTGTFYLLSGLLLFFLGKEIFNEKIGLVSGLLFFLAPQMLYYSFSGLTESVFIFFLLLSFYFLFKSELAWHFCGVGALLGLARLVRLNALFFVLPFMLYIFFVSRDNKLKKTMLFILGFLAVTLPEMVRGYLTFGDPIFCGYALGLFHFKVSADEFARSLLVANVATGGFAFSFADLLGFFNNYLFNLKRYYNHFYSIVSVHFISAMFVAGSFRWYKPAKVNLIKAVFLLALIVQALALSLSHQELRYFDIFVPLIVLFAVEFMFFLVSALPFRRKIFRSAILAVMVGVVAIPMFSYYCQGTGKGAAHQTPKYLWLKDFLARNTDKGDVVVTDISEAVAWYGERTAIELPLSVAILNQLHNDYLAVDWVLLTSFTTNGNEWRPVLSDWDKVYKRRYRAFGSYVLIDVYRDENELGLLYRNRNRKRNRNRNR